MMKELCNHLRLDEEGFICIGRYFDKSPIRITLDDCMRSCFEHSIPRSKLETIVRKLKDRKKNLLDRRKFLPKWILSNKFFYIGGLVRLDECISYLQELLKEE